MGCSGVASYSNTHAIGNMSCESAYHQSKEVTSLYIVAICEHRKIFCVIDSFC